MTRLIKKKTCLIEIYLVEVFFIIVKDFNLMYLNVKPMMCGKQHVIIIKLIIRLAYPTIFQL